MVYKAKSQHVPSKAWPAAFCSMGGGKFQEMEGTSLLRKPEEEAGSEAWVDE